MFLLRAWLERAGPGGYSLGSAIQTARLDCSHRFGDASSSSGGRHGFLGGSRKNARSYASIGSGPSELSSTGSRGHLDGLSGTDWGLTGGADLLDNSPRPLNGPSKKNGQNPVALEDSLSPLMPLVSGAGVGEPSIRGGMVAVSRTTTSPPRPAPELRSPVLDKDETPDGRLGTWAGRQRVFADFLREEEAGGAGQEEEEGVVGSVPGSDMTAEGLEPGSVTSMGGHIFQSESGERREETRRKRDKEPSSGAPAVLRPPPVPHVSASTPGEDDEINMAWRWRFTRKWQVLWCKFSGRVLIKRGVGCWLARRLWEVVALVCLFHVGMYLGGMVRGVVR